MIITMANFKGGVGKTSVATQLAMAIADRYGSDSVLLADGDPNQSAKNWNKRGMYPLPVFGFDENMKDQAEKKSHVVIDTAARDEDSLFSLARDCDMLVIPTIATAMGLEATMQTVDVLPASSKSKRNYCVLLTMVELRKKNATADAIALFKRMDIPVFNQTIRRFAAYEKASLAGCSLKQVKNDRYKGIAWMEITNLLTEIEEIINNAQV